MAERSVERVAALLEPLGIAVVRLHRDTRTAELAAQALGTAVGSIVKSLLFFADEQPVLVLAAGDRRVDPARVAREVRPVAHERSGRPDRRVDPARVARERGAVTARLARAEEVRRVTGFAIGGVPPVGHVTPLPVLQDTSLRRFPTVYAAAGSPFAIFPVTPDQLQVITGAQVVEVTAER